ncbi:NAD synthetase [Acinetobacter phage vB_AbaM_ME3]|uniref:NAD synthetase n=1 Tax=Acinetobacter phage vB_AbaM_ME3 TaxID=1837876 RepID=A0A172Q0Z8_9CAUD|nr:NAD synthetase [Acinetobacter phage vB_AbaM_ME3]AND75459.1 NAD synthetase [Acinetobacter phage vB_AbaM_ME3]
MIYKTITHELITKKVNLLHNVLQKESRKTLIVGVSGGVDSAVVLGFLKALDTMYPNTYTVIPILAPISESDGTTEQEEAYNLGKAVCTHFEYEEKFISLREVAKACVNALSLTSPYLQQQNDYWLRPMAFYAEATRNENSILVSTTNYSEWSLGWFSQYLDILGIHPIIEFYKSEVIAIAKYFNIPEEILNTPPKGGLASGRTDEQELGFTYQQFEDYELGITVPHSVANRIQDRINSSEFKRFRFNTDFIFRTEL